MKTGILGGTFNPIHLAHLRIAEEVRESCGLDRVLFIPAADPPHKQVAGEVPFARRMAMVQAAIAEVFAASKACGKPSGILAPVEADARRYAQMGATFIGVGSDLGLLRGASQALRDKFLA